MNILMLDAETLALTPDAAVLQIGGLVYDLAKGEPLAAACWYPSLEQPGRRLDIGTVLWWLQQSEGARKAVYDASTRKLPIEIATAIQQLIVEWKIETVWAKPAMFDLPLLTSYFGFKPWHYRMERDMQTLVRMYDPNGLFQPDSAVGRAHDAVYDCEWQCQYLRKIYEITDGFALAPRMQAVGSKEA